MNSVNKTEAHNDQNRVSELSSSKAWWLLASAIAVAIVLGLGTLDLIRLLALPLAVFIFGLTLAAALEPAVAWLENWMPRLVAMLVVYLTLLLVFGGLLWLVVPSLVNQVVGLSDSLPALIDRVTQFINRWRGSLPGDSLTNTLLSQLSSLGSTLLQLPIVITSALSGVVLILFLSFYMLLEASDAIGFFLSLFSEERRPHVREVISAMGQSMGGYVRGSVITGLITGTGTFLGLQLLGINFALTLGVMTGLLELIPVAGPIIAAVIIVALTIIESPLKALYALLFMIVLQQVENHILVPNIMRNQTDVSPLLAILALFSGAAIGGLLGGLIAIPVAAALRVLVQQVIAPAIRRKTHAEPVEEGSG